MDTFPLQKRHYFFRKNGNENDNCYFSDRKYVGGCLEIYGIKKLL